jgi:hypothetical protein
MAPSRYLNGEQARARFGTLADIYAASLDRGDPAADAAIEALHSYGQGRWWETVANLLERPGEIPSDCPPQVTALLASLPPAPSAATQARYDRGADVVQRTGESAGLVLTCAALLIDYWSPAFSKPLVLTGSLLDDTGHRLGRTSAWWMELHKPEGSHRDQDGYKTTIHVRLVHAFVRRMALKSGHWDSAAWGVPVNQGDLLFQAVGFTWLTLRSLERIGYRMTASDKALYYEFWRYVGAILGVDAELLPLLNDSDCAKLWDLWLLTNPGPDDDSVRLTEATLRTTAESLGPGRLKDSLYYPMLCGVARWLLGNDICDGLKVPKTYWGSLLPITYRPAVAVSEFFDQLPYSRPRAAASRVRHAVTDNPIMGIVPKGTNVVVEPDRLLNLSQFAAVPQSESKAQGDGALDSSASSGERS